MKLSAINASTRGVSAELIVELNGVYYEAVRFGIGDDAVDVAARLRHMAARIEYRTSRTPAPGVTGIDGPRRGPEADGSQTPNAGRAIRPGKAGSNTATAGVPGTGKDQS